MSNEVAVVRFKNGDVFYTAYQGTGSAINYILRPTENEVLVDPFPDPEWEAWLAKAGPEDDQNEFYLMRDRKTYPDEEDVEVYTPYADGLSWSAKASRSQMRVTANFSDDDDPECQEGCPKWAQGLIESRLLKQRG